MELAKSRITHLKYMQNRRQSAGKKERDRAKNVPFGRCTPN